MRNACMYRRRHGFVRLFRACANRMECHPGCVCAVVAYMDVVTPVFVQPSFNQKPYIHHRQCDKDNF